MSVIRTPPAGTRDPRRAEPKIGSALVVVDRSPLRVLLIDEQQMFTDALSRLLATEPDLEPVGAVQRIDDAVAVCQRSSPDVILVDLRVGGIEGVDGIRALRRASPAS